MRRTIIDVREPFEFAMSSVDGAINMPLSRLSSRLEDSDLDVDDELILYCNSGNRSAQAMAVFEAHGYQNVVNGINQSTVEHNFC